MTIYYIIHESGFIEVLPCKGSNGKDCQFINVPFEIFDLGPESMAAHLRMNMR